MEPDVVSAAADALARGAGFGGVASQLGAAAGEALAGWRSPAATAAAQVLDGQVRAVAAGDDACAALVAVLRWYAAELRIGEEAMARVSGAGDTAGADGVAAVAAVKERHRLVDERAAAAIEEARGALAAMALTAGPAPGPAPATEDDGRSWSEAGHLALDVIGLVPVVGEVADVANAAWYGLEGDHTAAALSLAAAVPIAGWAFTGGKLGVKGVRMVKDADSAKAWVTGRPSMVPLGARRLEYKGVGEKFGWTDPTTGKTTTYHSHGIDPDAPPGSNALTGPVYRLRQGQHHLDAEGNRYTPSQLRPGSTVYDPAAAKDTHIPYADLHPGPWEPSARVFLPNGAAFADPAQEPR